MRTKKSKSEKQTVTRGSIRVTIRPILNRGKQRFQLEWYNIGGELQRRSRSTEEEAKEEADKIINQINAGDREATTFSGTDKKEYEKCTGMIKGTGYDLAPAISQFTKCIEKLGDRATLPEAVDYFLKYAPVDMKTVTVSEVVEEFLNVKVEEVSAKSFRDYNVQLTNLAKAFQCNLEEVTEKRLRKYIEGKKITTKHRGKGEIGTSLSNQTRKNILLKIHAFFVWAKKENYLPPTITAAERLTNVVKARNSRVWKTSTKGAVILKLNEAKKLLNGVREDLQPYTALLLFAGLRPSEAKKLRWEHIDYDEEYIEIKPEVGAKLEHERFIPLQPTLVEWLEPHRKKSGLITFETSDIILTKEAVDKLKMFDAWPHDVCRHSYASYRLAVIKNKNQLAEEMGNSVTVINKHYRRPIKTETGEKYFDLFPKG